MPLALDFTSTWVMGHTLPVATTERAMSPVSTLASWVGSSLVLLPMVLAATTPPVTRTARVTPRTIQRRLRDLRAVVKLASKSVAVLEMYYVLAG